MDEQNDKWAYCLKHSWTPESPCHLCRQSTLQTLADYDQELKL